MSRSVSRSTSLIRRLVTGAVVAAFGVSVLSGCVGTSPSAGSTKDDGVGQYVLTPDTVPHDASAPITVWVDEARAQGFKDFAKAHPEYKFDIQTISGSDFLTKIQLANRAGSGWPDIVFPNKYLANLATKQYDYFTQPLNGIIPKKVLDAFGTSNDAYKTSDGYLLGLRNDVAPSVFYYNTEEFTQFGYQVPKTMDDLVALAEDVKANHPGYILQFNGNGWMTDLQFLQSSGCPYQQLTGNGDLRIALSDSKCTRAVDVLDKLLATGVVQIKDLTDAQSQTLAGDGKLLATVNAVWRADYTFPGMGWKAGTLGVAAMPTWGDAKGDDSVGYEGGGFFALSRHAKNMKGALEALTYVATSDDVQLAAPTMPAYGPAQTKWLDQKVPKNKLYADPTEAEKVYAEAAAHMDTVNALTQVDVTGTFPIEKVQQGSTFADVMPNWASKMTEQARAAGIAVVTK